MAGSLEGRQSKNKGTMDRNDIAAYRVGLDTGYILSGTNSYSINDLQCTLKAQAVKLFFTFTLYFSHLCCYSFLLIKTSCVPCKASCIPSKASCVPSDDHIPKGVSCYPSAVPVHIPVRIPRAHVLVVRRHRGQGWPTGTWVPILLHHHHKIRRGALGHSLSGLARPLVLLRKISN